VPSDRHPKWFKDQIEKLQETILFQLELLDNRVDAKQQVSLTIDSAVHLFLFCCLLLIICLGQDKSSETRG
jgi:hypothetical protein